VLQIDGADKLHELARVLKVAGEKDLRRQVLRNLTRAMKPVRVEAKRSLVETMPKRGGLARAKARQVRFRTSTRTGASTAGVRLLATGGQVRRIDREGQFRHPVFNRHDVPWESQRVNAGWFTRPTRAAAPQVRAEVERALNDVARQIEVQL
jgi:hypothetical protein